MSTPLTALPSELFNCVVAKIESKLTLCNLSRCSRELYRCTIPHLYRRIMIEDEIWRGEAQNGQLRNLASLLIRRPDLAGLVRDFTYTVHLSEEYEDPEYDEEIETPEGIEEYGKPTVEKVDQDLEIAVNASSSSKEDADNWLSQLSHTHKCHHGALLALLLPVLLKVENLALELEGGSGKHYLERMIQRAARKESPFDIDPVFASLTVFMLSGSMSDTLSTDFLASLLRLPAIQKVSGGFSKTWEDNFGEYRVKDSTLKELDSSSSSLTSLDLGTLGLSTADLGHLFRAPKALKTLFCNVYPQGAITFTDIQHALKPQKNCLVSLGFDYSEGYARFYNKVGTLHLGWGLMTSFTSFNTVKAFKTAALFLQTTESGTGHHSLIDIFPRNLETLHLNRLYARFATVLEALEHLLAKQSPQQLPSLKKLILEETHGYAGRMDKMTAVLWKGTQDSVIGRLSKVAAARGVSVDVLES